MNNLKLKKGLAAVLLLGTLVGCGTTDKEKVKDDEIVDKDIDGKKEEDNLKPDILNTTDMTVEELLAIQQEEYASGDYEVAFQEAVWYDTNDETINIPANVQREAGLYVKYRYNKWELDAEGNIIDDTLSTYFSNDNTSLYDIYRGKGEELHGYNVLTTEEDIKAGRHILEYKDKKYQLQFIGYAISKVKDYKINDGKLYAGIYWYNSGLDEGGVTEYIIQDESVMEEVKAKSK